MQKKELRSRGCLIFSEAFKDADLLCLCRMKQRSEADRRSPEGERRSPSSEDEKEDKESSAEITNPEYYKEIFQPHSVICEF